MNSESESLQLYLQQIINLSLDGKIPWVQSSPSTLNWNRKTSTDHYVVSIQKAYNPKFRELEGLGLLKTNDKIDYLFQISDKKSASSLLSISSKDRPEYYSALSLIYKSAEKSVDIRASRILEEILNLPD